MKRPPSRIAALFARLAKENRAAFIPFVTAGDPDLASTEILVRAIVDAGADLVELGVPFSDPIADGPVIQAASQRALAAGTNLTGILALTAALRRTLDAPLVLFSYFNPLRSYGLERFARDAAASGIDGVLCVDLPPEEAAEEFLPAMRAHGIDAIFLLAPTSTRERVRAVARAGSGFVYYVSRTGVTGERSSLAEGLAKETAALRRRLDLPLAVGFGISTPEQASEVARSVDAVVVGSALVRLVGDHAGERGWIDLVARRAAELAAAVRGTARR